YAELGRPSLRFTGTLQAQVEGYTLNSLIFILEKYSSIFSENSESSTYMNFPSIIVLCKHLDTQM
ncbi:hypothetical protein ACQP3F_27685, partial [Escherichia coli]